jgi:TolB-like protein/DNA-binding SARP family transcriptional activator
VTDVRGHARSSTDRYRLRTFGTLALAGPEDDTLLGKHGHQHRRLALLAVLAAAGEEGRSRDQLHVLFWPDATQARARHSLEQLLYAIRTSIHEEVFAGVNPVRLNSAVVCSDIGDFQKAIAANDLARAVELYRGPFLDGFYLSDAPEFEQWLNAERSNLERIYSVALERLAQKAAAERDHTGEIRWRRELAVTDPVSSKNATGLIRAMMSAGDNASALQFAEQYEAIVAKELGTSVGPSVASLVAEARANTKSDRVASEKSAPAPVRTVSQSPPRIENAPMHSAESRKPKRRWVRYAIAVATVIVAIAVIGWIGENAGSRKRQLASERSIVVLPFVNITADRNDAALVDGLSEELIAVLSRIPNLRVIARTSSFAFRNSKAEVREIADSLGVSNVMEGAVQRDGTKLRVQVRLVNALDGSTRWSETYDRELKDLFDVQSDIAGAVAHQLDLRLGEGTLDRISRRATHDIAAYELYLRGNDQVLFRSDSGARAGLEYFRQAIAIDPGYSAAYAGLARMHKRLSVGEDTMSRRDRLALAEEAALKSVALDDSSGEAHAALAMVRKDKYAIESAETELKRAVELDPTTARFREELVQLYVSTGRPAEALVEARRALELDPLSPTTIASLASALLANDRCDEGLAQLDKIRSLRPPLNRAGSIAAQCYAKKQMWPEAIAELQHILPNGGPRAQALLGYMLGRAGRKGEARQILASVLARSQRIHGDAFNVAIIYAGLGDNDRAFEWLGKSIGDLSFGVDWAQTFLDGLRSDRRFEEFSRRAGLRR